MVVDPASAVCCRATVILQKKCTGETNENEKTSPVSSLQSPVSSLQSPVSSLGVLVLLTGLFGACNAPLNQADPVKELFDDKNVAVTWNESSSDVIESYAADVEIWYMNNRTDTACSLRNAYRMVTKNINGTMYSRIDMPESTASSRMLSIVTNGEESVVADAATGKVELRTTHENPVTPALKTLHSAMSHGRVNLSLIRSEARRIALDMTENDDGTLLLDLPASMMPSIAHSQLISSKIKFDTVNEIVTETESILIKDAGVQVVTTTIPVYEMSGDEPVKVGTVTTIKTTVPERIENFDEDVPVFNTPEDIPEIDEEEARELFANGQLTETSVRFGDPASLDSIETVVEVYKNVEINTSDSALFDVILGGN